MKKKTKFNELSYEKSFLGPIDKKRVEIILDLIGNGQKILDIGCGRGEIGRLMGKGGNNQVFGLDIVPSLVRAARQNGLRAQVVDIEEEAIPFQEKFDFILAGEIIEHVFDTQGFLKKISRSLKKDGQLIITTPNLASLGRRLLLLVGKNPLVETTAAPGQAGHIRYFVKETLFELLEANHFRVAKFTSDLINFTPSGEIHNCLLAKIFPSLGKTLIVLAVKTK